MYARLGKLKCNLIYFLTLQKAKEKLDLDGEVKDGDDDEEEEEEEEDEKEVEKAMRRMADMILELETR